MEHNTIVSVVIPTYNMAPTLDRAIQSVLNQTYTDFELIIVDDGSTDATSDIVRPYALDGVNRRIRYIKTPNEGVSAAKNKGIAESGGKYIAFLDADDWLDEESLERRVNRLDKYPSEIAVFSQAWHANKSSEVYGVRKPQGYADEQDLAFKCLVELRSPFNFTTLMYRAEILMEIGGFNPSYRRAEDIELFFRLIQRGSISYIDSPLYFLDTSTHNARQRMLNRSLDWASRLRIAKMHFHDTMRLNAYLKITGNAAIKLLWELFSHKK